VDEVEGLDEEFLFHLNRGSDLLAHGDAAGARGALEKALELRGRDPKVLGLLGQACYRLGKYEDAIVAWQRLVDESPAEPSARVNLGLAFLRAGRQSQAIRQLEIALDLNPEHKKAMGYLGLALLESGDPLRAREWFVRAGSDQMVARCDQAIGQARPPAPAEQASAGEGGAAAGGAEAAGSDDLAADVEIEDAGLPPEPEPEPEPERPAAEARAEPEIPEPSEEEEPDHGHAPPSAAAEPAHAAGAEAGVAAYAAVRSLAVPEGAPFGVGVGGHVVAVRVRGAVRVRLAGLLAVRGAVEAEPEVKRFRGRPTEKPFGVGAARFHRVRGEGTLIFSAGKRRFTALPVVEAAFLREEALFALEDELVFENGRVPGSGAEELNLVHLRGHGAVLLGSAGVPLTLEVHPEAPLRLPLEALVGWTGAVTPRLGALVEGGPVEVVGVELSGEGQVLVDPGATGLFDVAEDGEPT
jgi:hypothetical protein